MCRRVYLSYLNYLLTLPLISISFLFFTQTLAASWPRVSSILKSEQCQFSFQVFEAFADAQNHLIHSFSYVEMQFKTYCEIFFYYGEEIKPKYTFRSERNSKNRISSYFSILSATAKPLRLYSFTIETQLN